MEQDAVLTIFDRIRDRVFGIKDAEQADQAGFVYSMFPVGIPLNAEQFRDPASSYDVPAVGEDALAKVAASLKAGEAVARFVDHKFSLDGTGRALMTASTISQTWETIVKSAERHGSAPPQTEDAKKRVEDAKRVLTNPDKLQDNGKPEESVAYKQYKLYQTDYLNARTAFASAYSKAKESPVTLLQWADDGVVYQQRLDTAWDEWVSLGNKDEIEAAFASMSANGMFAVDSIIQLAEANLERYRKSTGAAGARYLSTQIFPSDWAEPETGDGWTTFKFKSTQVQNEHSSAARSWGGGGGVRFGFWSTGGAAGGNESVEHKEYSSDELEIELSFGIATIERPWLTNILLNVRGWKCVGQAKHCISNGQRDQLKPPGDDAQWLPALPVQLAICKNIRIRSKDSKAFYHNHIKNSHGTAGGGWGPFRVSGSASWSSQTTSTSSSEDEGWLTVNGAQVVGVVLAINPAAPSVDG